jgi:NitT/TauT family transport system substrate-binding protein
MALKIMPHGRLQEWVAEEKGYFAAEGLEYAFVHDGDYGIGSVTRDDSGQVRTGAFETFEAGRSGANVSCACHWATSAAASEGSGQLITTAYSVAPCAIVVPPESPVRRPEDLAGVDIGVGYHSGSHFSAIQALEAVLEPAAISLRFLGMPYDRVDALLARDVAAANIWGAACYLLEQQGFRKVLDSTFMAGFLFSAHIDAADVAKYFSALKRAQMDLDFEPERYKHYYLREIPERFHDLIDVRGFGTGERVVFLPYTNEMYERSQAWMRERNLFEDAAPAQQFASVVQL